MNDRIVWMARIAGLVMLLIFAFLMLSLRSKLTKLEKSGAGPSSASSSSER